MKIWLLLITVLLVLAGCKPRTEEVIISGKVDGYSNKPIWVYPATSTYLNKPYGMALDSAVTNSEGQFRISIHSNAEYYHVFTEDDFLLIETPIAAKPNDSLFFRTSIYNASRPEFSGSNAVLNQLMLTLRQNIPRNFRSMGVFEKPIDDFLVFVDSVEKSANHKIDSVGSANSAFEHYSEILRADFQLYLSFVRYHYLQKHLNVTKGKQQYLLPHEGYYKDRKLLDKYEKFWFLPSYTMLADAMLEDDIQRGNDLEGNSLAKRYYLIDGSYKETAKEVALARLTRKFPDYLGYSNSFRIFEQVDSLISYEINKSALKEYANTNIRKIAQIKPGSLAPNIKLPNAEGDSVSLKSMRGNVVLIVFWGTWCPPCLASLPKYIDIQEQFKSDEVKILYVSLEARSNEVESWREFVKGKGELANRLLKGEAFSGIHLVARGQFANPQVKSYAVTSAPSYVLIGKDGRIVKPRVSLDKDLITQINELIGK
ncbi:MAG: peroxiredoxin family protein [Bacteroidales bacterium]